MLDALGGYGQCILIHRSDLKQEVVGISVRLGFFYLYRYLPLRISAVARKHRQNLGGDANDRR